MPITQPPTLNNIDPDHGQFEIQFGLEMVTGEARQALTIPNLGPVPGVDVYKLDLSNVITPARGNFPAIRSLAFTLRTIMAQPAGVPAISGQVYILNPATNQIVGIVEPTPAGGADSIVTGNIPFFFKSTQALVIYRNITSVQNCFSFLSVSAFTFDCSAFLTSMTPAPTLFTTGTPAAVQVEIVGPSPLPVSITGTPVPIVGTVGISGQPISVTATNFGAVLLPPGTSGTDLNTLQAFGYFQTTGSAANVPVTNFDYLVAVFPTTTAGYATQMAWELNTPADPPRTYVRQVRLNTWTPWEVFTMAPALAATAAKKGKR